MAISRPTLREAIKVLSDAGVLAVRQGRNGGMFVRSDVIPPGLLEERSQLRMGEVAGVLEARRLLEPRVAQLAALYATDDDFEAMQQTIDLQKESGDDFNRFIQLGTRFHMAMARATRNATVVALMRLLLRQLDIVRDVGTRTPEDREWAIAIHQRTLQAIKSADADEIDAAMDEHLSFLERIWEEESGRARLRKIPDFLLPRADRPA